MSTSQVDTFNNELSEITAHMKDLHTHGLIEQLVFFDLHNNHWLLFHHDLQPSCKYTCTAYNSLVQSSGVIAINNQWIIHEYVSTVSISIGYHSETCSNAHFLHFQTPISWTFNTVSLGVQSASSACGFWMIFVAFGLTQIPVVALGALL